MKAPTIEQIVMAASPQTTPDAAFTNRVMQNILERAPAKTKTHKQVFGFLRHMPKLALGLLAIAVVLAVTGTAYAVYTVLWQKPAVHSQGATQNQFGRTEVVVGFESCANQKEAHYEIKKGATITPNDVPKILQAKCEKAAINAALVGSPGRGHRASETTDGEVVPFTNITSAVNITNIDEHQINFGHELNITDGPYALSADTKYVANGIAATRADFAPGDTVMFVTTIQIKYTVTKKDGGISARGDQVGDTHVNYVIKLGLPAEYYNAGMLSQIVERTACTGNPQDTCLEGAAIELYDGANAPLIEGPDDTGELRELQGVIKTYTARSITIQTSSGKMVTINLPRDIIAEYNNSRSANYDGVQVKTGDTLAVNYFTHDKSKPTTEIAASEVMWVTLKLDLVYKNDPLNKY